MATNGYQLTRIWFDFSFENPDIITVNDTALYCILVEINNRCGWSEKFSITAKQCMDGAGFNTYPPYKKSLDKLIALGFVKLVRKSANQYQCNVIALSKNNKATTKALDKALVKAPLKQPPKHLSYSLNTETPNPEPVKGSPTPKRLLPVYPTENEVKEYFKENGYIESEAIKAFKYYNEADWYDSKGNKVLNWKQKMQSVWFKEDKKIVSQQKRGLVH